MDLIHPLAEVYAADFTTEESSLLQEINRFTTEHHAQPHMLSGHVQGRFLSMISTILRPRYVLEIGTFTGYSALCLAEGLVPEGELHTIELRPEDAALSQAYFNRSVKKEQIHQHTGNAIDIIPQLQKTWDLVFIDADKPGYIGYYELVMPLLRPGGLILADNVLFHGQVLEETVSGKNAMAIQAFNEHVKNDPRSEQVLVTLRDGILMIQKKM